MGVFFGIAGFVLSIFSIWLTWHFSDRYSLREKIYEKRLLVALELIETVKSLNFISHFKKKDFSFYGRIHTTKFKINFPDEYKRFKDVPVFFATHEYQEIFKKLHDIRSNPYLDKNIVKSLDFLDISTSYYVPNFTKIENGALFLTKNNYDGPILNPYSFPSLESYFKNMENVIDETKKWLKNKSRLNDEFNI